MSQTQLNLEDVLDRLQGVRRHGGAASVTRRAVAQCPAHEDRDPSLSVSEGRSCILLHCFAGCTFEEICHALSIEPTQLLYELTPQGVIRRPAWVQEAQHLRQLNLEGE